MVEERLGRMRRFVKRWWALLPVALLLALALPSLSDGQVPPDDGEEEAVVDEEEAVEPVEEPAPPPAPVPAPVPPQELDPVDEPPLDEPLPPPAPAAPPRQPLVRPNGRQPAQPDAAAARDYEPDPRFPDVDPRVTLELNVAESIDIRLLVDVVSEELKINFLYDELQGPITLKPQTAISRVELFNLLERALQLKGYSMITVQPGWILIVPAGRIPQWGEFGAEATMAIEPITLQYADARDIQEMMTPFLSDGGMIVTMPDTTKLYLIEYRTRIPMLRQVIEDMDVRPATARAIIDLQYAKASEIGEKLVSYLNSRPQQTTRRVPVQQQVGTTRRTVYTTQPALPEPPPMIDIDAKTNRLIIIGTAQAVAELEDIVEIYDVPPVDFQTVRLYELMYVEAAEALAAMEQIGVVGDLFSTTTPTVRQPTRQPTRRGQPQPTTVQAGALGGVGAVARVAVVESQNALLIRATQLEHEQIRRVLETVDHAVTDQGMIRLLTLDYRNPDDVAEILREVMGGDRVDPRTGTPVPGREGAPTIVSVPTTNSIIVNATPAQHESIRTIVRDLDIDQPQVLLETTLIEVTERDDLDVGVEWEGWQLGGDARTGDGGVGSTTFGFSPRDAATGLRVLTGADGASALGAGLSAAWLNDDVVIALIRALQTRSNARVLSKPRILVNNNEAGMIESLDEEPVQEIQAVTVGSTVTGFKEFVSAGTRLEITPHISMGDFLQLEIAAEVSTFTGVGGGGGLLPPPRATRRIETLITVPNRRTIVIGGLHGRRLIKEINQVPLLGDVPLLGELFKRRTTINANTKIYLFVKATILRETDFGDLLDETQGVRDIMPEDLQALDPSLTTEAAVREAKKLNEVLQRYEKARVLRSRSDKKTQQDEPERIPLRVMEIPAPRADEVPATTDPTVERVRPAGDPGEPGDPTDSPREQRRNRDRRESVIVVPMNP